MGVYVFETNVYKFKCLGSIFRVFNLQYQTYWVYAGYKKTCSLAYYIIQCIA